MAQTEFKFNSNPQAAIVSAPDTELKSIFLECLRLLEHTPEILSMIENDINLAAKGKKVYRLENRDYYYTKHGQFPGFELVQTEGNYSPERLHLWDGRPRLLDSEALFLMMMCRAHLDSVTSKQAYDRLKDSMVINGYLSARGLRLPAATTIHESLNVISQETLDFIFKSQIEMIVSEDLDPMTIVALDSFSVSGNTEWPTDSRIMLNLLRRAYRLGTHRLFKFGLPGFTESCIPGWLKKLHQLNFKIANTCGKAKSKGKIKKLYRKLLKVVNKILLRMIRRVSDCLCDWEKTVKNLVPNHCRMAQAIINQLILDLQSVIRVYTYAGDRVFHKIILPAPEKILSLSDACVSFIKKGGREAVIGYKPQVVRSGKGFITAIEIEEGNPSDSSRLIPMIIQHCENTSSTPKIVTVDDGYSSALNRKRLKRMGVDTVSIGGAKGKKITPESDWNSPEYEDARRNRSSVESIIFVLRYKFHLGSFTRRGIDGVKAELTEKVIAHNFWRMCYLRKQLKLPLAA